MPWKCRKYRRLVLTPLTDSDPRYMNLFLSTWALLVAGLVFSLPMIHLRVKDHTDIEYEDE